MASSIMENMGNEILLNKCPDPNIKDDSYQGYETVEIIESYIKRTNMQVKITGQTQNLFGILRKTRRLIEKNLRKIKKKDMQELKPMIKSMMETSFAMIDILQPTGKMAQDFKTSPVDDGFKEKADFCTNVNKAEFVDTVSHFTCDVKTEKVEVKEERMDEAEVEKQMEEGKVEERVENQMEQKMVQEQIKEEKVEEQMEEEEFDDRMDEGNSDDEERTCFQNEPNTSFEDQINKRLSYLAPENKLKVPKTMGINDRKFSLDQRVECIRLINSEHSVSYQHFYHYYYNYYSNHYQNYYENYQAIQQTYDPRLCPQQQPYPGYFPNTMY